MKSKLKNEKNHDNDEGIEFLNHTDRYNRNNN